MKRLSPRITTLLFILFSSLIGHTKSLSEQEVLKSIERLYPPYLAELIKHELGNAKVQGAIGSFDTRLSLKAQLRPKNYYDASNYEAMLERPFMNSGGFLYGGYRLSQGYLPSYYRKYRTSDYGEAVIGLNIPLLRDRKIDQRRASLSKAEIDRELATPSIALQYLGILEAARKAYYDWVIRGYVLRGAEDLLNIAQARQKAFTTEVQEGARAEIILVDNKRILVERQLLVNQAQLDFDNAAQVLSLFYRSQKSGAPIVASEKQHPKELMYPEVYSASQKKKDLLRIRTTHPELKTVELLKRKANIDLELAQNNKKPDLSFVLEMNRNIYGDVPKDIEETELEALIKFTIPIGQNEAKGAERAAKAQLEQLALRKTFVKDQLASNLEVTYAALKNAFKAITLNQENETLAQQLLDAENNKFNLGASTLLNLQLREQTLLSAKLSTLNSIGTYYSTYAAYLKAAAIDLKGKGVTSAIAL